VFAGKELTVAQETTPTPISSGEALFEKALKAKRHETHYTSPETGLKIKFRVDLSEQAEETAMVSIFFKRSDLPKEIGKVLETARGAMLFQCDRVVSVYWGASMNDEKLVFLHINKAVREETEAYDDSKDCHREQLPFFSKKQMARLKERVRSTSDVEYLRKAVNILFELIERALKQ
jgi:hypothetical protein